MFIGGAEFLVMLLLTAGNANQMLDLLDTQVYWQQQGVEQVTVEAMLPFVKAEGAADRSAEIEGWIKDLAAREFEKRDQAYKKLKTAGEAARKQLQQATKSDDSEVAASAEQILKEMSESAGQPMVQKLLAIRALGELKDKQALPTLEKLVASKEPFVAGYARQAIARIKGEKYVPPALDRKLLDQDLWVLPKDCRVVGQMVLADESAFSLRDLIKMMPKDMDLDIDEMLQEATRELTKGVNRVGNIRVDSVTLGVVGNPVDDGYVTVIFRGEADPELVATFIKSGDGPPYRETREVEGVQVHYLMDSVFFMLSPKLAVFMVIEKEKNLPVAETIKAIKAGEQRLSRNEKMVERIKSLKREDAMQWGVVEIYDDLKTIPGMDAFEVVTMKTTRQGQGQNRKTTQVFTGQGSDADKVAATMDMYQKQLAETVAFMKAMSQNMPEGQPKLDGVFKMLESIKFKADGKTATVSSTVTDEQVMSLMGAFLMASPRSDAGVAPANATQGAAAIR